MITFIFHSVDGEQFKVHVCRKFISFIGEIYYFDCPKFLGGRIFEIHDNTNTIKRNTERIV